MNVFIFIEDVFVCAPKLLLSSGDDKKQHQGCFFLACICVSLVSCKCAGFMEFLLSATLLLSANSDV